MTSADEFFILVDLFENFYFSRARILKVILRFSETTYAARVVLVFGEIDKLFKE